MKRFLSIVLLSSVLCTFISCEKQPMPGDPETNRKILIYYGIGYNNLSSSLRKDIDELCSNAPSWDQVNYYKLIVFEHLSRTDYDYKTQKSPLLLDVYKDKEGYIVMDTLKVYPSGAVSASAETINDALTLVKNNFPAKEYGFVFSSHGTGWLPQGYYSNEEYFTNWTNVQRSAAGEQADSWKPSSYSDPLPGPLVKSIGAQFVGSSSNSKEIEIRDFVKAFPMKMEYVALDACLMGGIEMAYEFKDVTNYFAASQTEIMSEGLEYNNMLNRLLYPEKADLKGMCEDYYTACKNRGEGATVSLINCNKLDGLASICKLIFTEESEKIASVDPDNIQPFFRHGKHWFYDLRDIVVQAGITGKKLQSLDAALEDCVEYVAFTGKFLDIGINTDCGFSMYLPCDGSKYLDSFYGDFAWNKATSLVK